MSPAARPLAGLDPAIAAAAVLAVGGPALGGVRIRADAASGRAWIELLLQLSAAADALQPDPVEHPVRRLPPGATADRVSGGLDLAASLAAGRPVPRPGLLAEAHGGWLVLASAERLDPAAAAEVCAALDTGWAVTARDGLFAKAPARFAVLALDEGCGEDEQAAAPLRERLALHLPLRRPPPRAPEGLAGRIADARLRLADTRLGGGDRAALCERALELGEPSLRAPGFASLAARAAAALEGRRRAGPEDLDLAAALVLVPRAQAWATAAAAPAPAPAEGDAQAAAASDADRPPRSGAPGERGPDDDAGRRVAAEPAAPLDGRPDPERARPSTTSGGRGRAPARRRGVQPARGAPARVRRAADARYGLSIVETLKAAAPWQRARAGAAPTERFQVRPSDFRLRARRPTPRATVVFVVDASGSAAAERLAEAKGAVEALLGDCYARRDQVALIGFRQASAEVALAPTRAVERARRSLAELAAGGATPLAHALDAAGRLADQARRRGEAPLLVFVTDARANIGRSGAPGRAEAARDALAAAQALAAAKLDSLLVDISPRGERQAQGLADALRGRYLHLPHLSAETLAAGVQAARRESGLAGVRP